MGVPLLVLVPLEGGHTLEYKIKTISSKEEIVNCNRFEIDHVQWHHAITPPKACGYMGYLKGEGLYVQICTEEHDPLARCTEHHEMVCKDSAVEVFLAFAEKGKELTNNDMYLNFEVNANGAMYAKYGFGRQGRQFLKEVCDYLPDGSGKEIYCNFYKISEDPAVEHYISFSPIDSEKPNFHLPVFFAKAEVE